jgi:NTP pyrophosphatase (non-canonical NTP hydrolase)
VTNYDALAMRTEAQTTPEQEERLKSLPRPMHAILGLITELGEFTDPYKRFIYYGKEIDRVNAIEELGDILWYVAIAASSLQSTISQCQEANIAKLRKRFPHKFSEESALSRDLDEERRELNLYAPDGK